jgi:hypothetical protein
MRSDAKMGALAADLAVFERDAAPELQVSLPPSVSCLLQVSLPPSVSCLLSPSSSLLFSPPPSLAVSLSNTHALLSQVAQKVMRKANDKTAKYMLLVADLRKELLETRQVERYRRESGMAPGMVACE